MVKVKKTIKKSWKQRLLTKNFIIPASIIGVIIIGIGVYLIPDGYNHAVLNASVQNEGKALAAADKNLINPRQASSCDFVSGVGLGGGGWGCTAMWVASTSINDVKGMQAMIAATKKSSDFHFVDSTPAGDIQTILSKPPQFPQTSSSYITSLDYQKKRLVCWLMFIGVPSESNPAITQRVDVRLICEMDARLPWYSTTLPNLN